MSGAPSAQSEPYTWPLLMTELVAARSVRSGRVRRDLRPLLESGAALLLLPARRLAPAEDAAAQVFLNALAALPGFIPSGQANAFKAWLFTIAFRVVSNLRRGDTRHPHAPIETADELLALDPPFDEQAIASEEQETLFLLIRQLKPEQRQLVELRLAELTDADIAQVLGKSPVAIRKAQSRAVFALRALLDAQYSQSGGGPHA